MEFEQTATPLPRSKTLREQRRQELALMHAGRRLAHALAHAPRLP